MIVFFQVFLLIESIEMAIRQHFSVPNVHTYIPGTDLRKHILDKVLESEPTLCTGKLLPTASLQSTNSTALNYSRLFLICGSHTMVTLLLKNG